MCSQSAVPLDTTVSGDSIASTVCPDSGDTCGSPELKVSVLFCGVI